MTPRELASDAYSWRYPLFLLREEARRISGQRSKLIFLYAIEEEIANRCESIDHRRAVVLFVEAAVRLGVYDWRKVMDLLDQMIPMLAPERDSP